MNEIKKEIHKLEKEKAKAQLNNNLKQEAEVCNALGELFARNGQYEDALKEHQHELQLSESLKDLIGSAVANRKIGECYQELGDYQKALKHQKKHLRLAESAGNFVEQQRALATIGRTHLCQAESLDQDDSEKPDVIEKAKAAFLGSMDICESHLLGAIPNKEYQDMRGRLFLNLGLVFDCQKDNKNSVKFIQQAIHIAQKNNMKEDLIRCNLALSDIHQSGGDLPNSISCLESAVQVARELKDRHKESNILWLLGTARFHEGDFIAAKKALKKAYKLRSEDSQERNRVIRSLKIAIRCCKLDKEIEKVVSESNYKQQMVLEEDLADLCCKTNSYNQAIKHYKKQLECAKSLQVPAAQLIPIYVSLAATYADNEQYRSAVDMYCKELELRKGNPEEECRTWLNVADAQEKAGQEYEVLHQSYSKAIEYASSAGLPKLQYEALKSLKLVQEHFNEETHLSATIKKLNHLKAEHDLVSDDEESVEGEGTEHSSAVEVDTEDLLLELSDSGQSEEEEEYDRPLASRRIQRAKFSKTNEKGETLLHRACIEGNLKQVKSLLEQGHPVNPRDHCGWIPLHEACNHDHYDIVEVLLEHGAHINDRGGAKCGGITPLHDAVSCGNLEVAELLISKGASVIVKDDKGLTPLATLEGWRNTYEADLDQDVKDNSERLKQLLMDTARGSNSKAIEVINEVDSGLLDSDLFDNEEDSQSQSQTDAARLSQSSGVRRGFNETSRPSISLELCRKKSKSGSTLERSFAERRNVKHVSSSSSDSEDEDFRMRRQPSQLVLDDLPTMKTHKKNRSCPTNSIQKITNGSSNHVIAESEELSERVHDAAKRVSEDAKTSYCNAMARVGSAASRISAKQHSIITTTPTLKTGNTNPLLDEQEYVIDDWLVEDAMPTKRRRVGEGNFGKTTSRLGSSQSSSLKLSRKKQKKQTQLKLAGIVSQTHETSNTSKQGESDLEDINIEEVLSSSPPVSSQLTPSGLLDESHQGVIQSPPSSLSSAMRVKVRVQEKVFLISVPLSTPKTIQWLSDETSNRYYASSGLRPKLSMSTSDNALFSPEDVVTEILSNNEEVFAIVDSWDLPPLHERYKTQCEKVQQREHSVIKSRLQQTQTPHDIDLTGLTLKEQHVGPLFMALQSQYSLRTLILTRNRINDTLVGYLADALESLPNLYHVDLSCNEITHEGLQKISQTICKYSSGNQSSVTPRIPQNLQKPLQHLEKLILSYNPLTDSCAVYIANIVKYCPLLSELNLTSTNLTTRFCQLHGMALVEAFQGAKCLQYLNVSHNALGSTGVDLMLNCLNPEKIKTLNLSSVIPKSGDSNLTKHLATFFSKGNCAIQKLILEDCRLNDEDMTYLSKCIPGPVPICWTYLSLSTNPDLTAAGLRTLLTTFQESKCSIMSLDISMCGLKSPLDRSVYDLLAGFITQSHPSGETLNKMILSSNNLDKMDMEVLVNVWEVAHGDSSTHFIDKNRFILSV